MAFTFIGSSNAVGSGVTSLSITLPVSAAAGDLLILGYGLEGVAPGSGPWIIPNVGQLGNNGLGPFIAWQQLCWQAPSGTGAGLEVWGAVLSSGNSVTATFTSSQNVVCVCAVYRGEYNPTGNILGTMPRLAPTQQVTGNLPASPSVLANSGELVIAAGSDTMGAGGFGSPSGFTNRVDQARSGAGTVDATIADRVATVTGNTGPITFPNNASSSTAKGSTATLVFSPAPATAGAGGIINAGLPEDLDIGSGYTLRVSALDPTNGNPVSGVTVSNLIFTAEQVSGTPEGLQVGPFMLVPGPNA